MAPREKRRTLGAPQLFLFFNYYFASLFCLHSKLILHKCISFSDANFNFSDFIQFTQEYTESGQKYFITKFDDGSEIVNILNS